MDDSVIADAHSPICETLTDDHPGIISRSIDHDLSSHLDTAMVTRLRLAAIPEQGMTADAILRPCA